MEQGLLKKLTVTQSRNFPPFMEFKDLLVSSQELATGLS